MITNLETPSWCDYRISGLILGCPACGHSWETAMPPAFGKELVSVLDQHPNRWGAGIFLGRCAIVTDKELLAELEKLAVDKRVSCPQALALANRLGVSPAKVGEGANKLGIKIFGCQLGCFG